MTSPLDTANRWAVLGVTVFALGCLGMIAAHAPALALVNESPSLPRGLYVRKLAATPGVGEIVALRQPQGARPYLGALGMPSSVRLIKRVAAAEGDRVCRRGAEVQAQARTVSVRRLDRRGRVLPQWRDCRRLERGELFLLGDTAGSFDSRYFGPIRAEAIDGVFREVVTW